MTCHAVAKRRRKVRGSSEWALDQLSPSPFKKETRPPTSVAARKLPRKKADRRYDRTFSGSIKLAVKNSSKKKLACDLVL